MFGFDSPWHWLILLLIIVLVFGTSKLGRVGTDLSSAIRNFKKGLKEGEAEDEAKNKDAGVEHLEADDKESATADKTAHREHHD